MHNNSGHKRGEWTRIVADPAGVFGDGDGISCSTGNSTVSWSTAFQDLTEAGMYFYGLEELRDLLRRARRSARRVYLSI